MNARSMRFRTTLARTTRTGLAIVACLLLSGLVPGSAVMAGQRKPPKAPPAAGAPTAVAPVPRTNRVIAYYFHTTIRCASCRAIEAYSHEAIEKAFPDQIRDGSLVWKVVNIETPGNEHFAKDYALYTKSVVLVNEVRGKPARWKNLEKVWQLLQDKPKFLRYVQDETRAYLAEAS